MTEMNMSKSEFVENTFPAHLRNIFVKMALALAITGVVSYGTAQAIGAGSYFHDLLMNPGAISLLALAELIVAVVFRIKLFNMKPIVSELMLYLYSFLTGLTFSVIFAQYQLGTVYTAFLFSSVLFVSCAVIGYTTKADLTKLRNLLFAGLLTLLIVSVMSFFIPVLRDNLAVAYAGLIVFLGYTAYDIQVIKINYENFCMYPEITEKFASLGAFELYLDFINIFVYILRILGNSRSRR